MSFLSAVPDAVAQAASALESIGSRLSAASSAAAAPTTGIAAAAQDEISTAVAGLFGDFGAEFQGLSAEAQAFHDGFVDTLTGSMSQYLSAEAAARQLLAHPVARIESAVDNAVAASPLGQLVSAVTGIVDMPFSVTALDYRTPLGSLVVTLCGNASMLGLWPASVTAGSLAVSPPLAVAVDRARPSQPRDGVACCELRHNRRGRRCRVQPEPPSLSLAHVDVGPRDTEFGEPEATRATLVTPAGLRRSPADWWRTTNYHPGVVAFVRRARRLLPGDPCFPAKSPASRQI